SAARHRVPGSSCSWFLLPHRCQGSARNTATLGNARGITSTRHPGQEAERRPQRPGGEAPHPYRHPTRWRAVPREQDATQPTQDLVRDQTDQADGHYAREDIVVIAVLAL